MNPQKITTIAELSKNFKPIVNINVVHKHELSSLDKLALYVTENIGTMGFFFIILVFNLGWIGWNTFAPKQYVFDQAFSFLILLFINNILQILFMPLIMVGQNVQGHHSELRAENDYQVNLKSEKEIETMLLHLENQQKLLQKILDKLQK